MEKQYIAEYQHNTHDRGKWHNAAQFPKRYSKTLEEARADILAAKKYFDGLDKDRCNVRCGIGVTIKGDLKSRDALRIVKTRIRVREVTPWEIVEEETE